MEHESAENPIVLKLTDLPIDDSLEAFGKEFGVSIGSGFSPPPISKIRITANIEGKSLWRSLAALMRAGHVGYWDAFVIGPFPSLPGEPSLNTTRLIMLTMHSK